MNGAMGHFIYNNTTQAALAIGNIGGNRNIAKSVYNPNQLENRANAQPVSDRYLEKGNYVKLANATLAYNIGAIGRVFRGVNLFVTGQNLFVITKYSGFDPEVNNPRPINNVPSFGIEYTPYPSARLVTFGANISL
jgi:iron complex outermembrane receptor protein